MILTNTNINTVPFYSSLAEQSHKDSWATQLPIACPFNHLPIFQIATTDISSTPVLQIYDRYDTLLATINNAETGLTSKSYVTYRVVYNKSLELTNLLPTKDFYIKLTVGSNIYYSDLIIPTDTTNTLILEYWNLSDLEVGEYKIFSGQNGFYLPFRIWLDATIGKAEYPFIDDIDERMGYEFINHMISKKTFKFGFITNEQQFDALRICRISDKIAITFKGVLYKVLKINFSNPEWRDNGLAWIDAEFEVDSIMNKIGVAQPTRGDFNDDYSNDFFNT